MSIATQRFRAAGAADKRRSQKAMMLDADGHPGLPLARSPLTCVARSSERHESSALEGANLLLGLLLKPAGSRRKKRT